MIQRKKRVFLTFLLASLFLTACSAVGPGSVVRDRFDYNRAISDSWKTQMLNNLVGIRYGEAPIFLDVVSVINQYELQTQANLSASWQSPLRVPTGNNNNINANTLGLGGSGSYTDRPTITYSPLSGEQFAFGLMKPIVPTSILSLIQAGFPVDFIFRLSVQSINGVQNRYGGAARARTADPEFYRLLEQWKQLQASGAIALRVQKVNDEESLVIIFRKNVPEETEAEGAEVKKMLGLNPQKREFRVVYGAVALGDDEIAILSRSVLEIMIDLASYIEVPETHIAEKRVAPTFKDGGPPGAPAAPLIRVHSSPKKPTDAYVSVPYQDYWFWIDNKDLPSKQIFSSLMFVLTLAETGTKAGAPVVTIPTR
ncbi:MAG TPA: hypothetical protein VKF36_01295 [Syntrophorhabdales bacterium]|nr:hypothetical protein [Syntrophorhabdales bacterium]